jgi:hypothetical protein
MKQLFLAGISLLAVATFALPPNAAAQEPSATNTTNYYDGRYAGGFITVMHPTGDTSECSVFNVAPALTVKNGSAQFSASNIMFHGYVSPQGELIMVSDHGQTFVGQFDPYFVLEGVVTGKCIYHATWEKYTKRP